jgi:hypothetical protein
VFGQFRREWWDTELDLLLERMRDRHAFLGSLLDACARKRR